MSGQCVHIAIILHLSLGALTDCTRRHDPGSGHFSPHPEMTRPRVGLEMPGLLISFHPPEGLFQWVVFVMKYLCARTQGFLLDLMGNGKRIGTQVLVGSTRCVSVKSKLDVVFALVVASQLLSPSLVPKPLRTQNTLFL